MNRTLLIVFATLSCSFPASAQERALDSPVPPAVYDASEAAPRRARRAGIAGPLGVMIPGVALTAGGALGLLAVGLQSADVFEEGPPNQEGLWIGATAASIGVPLFLAGLYWLLNRGQVPIEEALRETAIRF